MKHDHDFSAAVETADVVLVKNDSADVPRSIVLARKVHGKIKQNLFWATIYNLIAIPVAAGALYRRLACCCVPNGRAGDERFYCHGDS